MCLVSAEEEGRKCREVSDQIEWRGAAMLWFSGGSPGRASGFAGRAGCRVTERERAKGGCEAGRNCKPSPGSRARQWFCACRKKIMWQ